MSTPSRPAQVLRLLLEADRPRSGQEMGELLGISREAVGKAIRILRGQGFSITARPGAGYLLESEPELVLPARVEARLEDGSLGLPLVHFEKLDSTNLEARRRAEAGAPHGMCLVAEYQSAGRGRLDRRWQAPARSCLLFSIVLRPHLGLEMVFGLTNLAALALCLALEENGLTPRIKWPNDVYLDGKKLAGILTEFTSRAERLDYAVVGVGLNVNLTPRQLAALPAPAASLRAATGRRWDRAPLLARILAHLHQLYQRFAAGEHQALNQDYAARSLLTGRRVSVQDGDRVLTGLARGLAPDGALILEDDSGQHITIRHGDVSVLAF